MRTANYTDLSNNLKSYLDGVVNNCEPLIIHRPENTSVVVISLEEYNEIKVTEYLTSSPEMMKRLRKAENNIKERKGIKIDLASL